MLNNKEVVIIIHTKIIILPIDFEERNPFRNMIITCTNVFNRLIESKEYSSVPFIYLHTA